MYQKASLGGDVCIDRSLVESDVQTSSSYKTDWRNTKQTFKTELAIRPLKSKARFWFCSLLHKNRRFGFDFGYCNNTSLVQEMTPTGSSMLQREVLIFKLVSVDALSTSAVVVSEVASLTHESWNDTVE